MGQQVSWLVLGLWLSRVLAQSSPLAGLQPQRSERLLEELPAASSVRLTQAGHSKEDAEIYAEGVRRGGTLLSARVPDGERARYEAILDQGAVNIRTRADAYRETGWRGFDPNARPYDSDQVRAEREMYIDRR